MDTVDPDRPATYAEYEAFCFSRGERLCLFEEICPTGSATSSDPNDSPAGTPSIFDLSSTNRIFPIDSWVPFDELVDNDEFGGWIQLGTNFQLCWNHDQAVTFINDPGAEPAWAADSQVFPWMQFTVCCIDP